jgi:hypothetical protein
MSFLKKILLTVAMLGGFAAMAAPPADAGIIFRGGPVRRVAYRAALPPYPVARRVAFGPVYRPYRPIGGFYGPGFYGPGISVGVGIY